MSGSALPPLADIEAFRAWPEISIGTVDEIRAAEAVLNRASAIVRRQAGKTFLNADGSALGDVPDGITSIVVQAAARFWNNPNGATLITKGPFTEGFPQAIEAGVYLTQSEKDEIALISGRTRPKLWTLPTTREHDDGDVGYLYDQYGGDPILECGSVDRPY